MKNLQRVLARASSLVEPEPAEEAKLKRLSYRLIKRTREAARSFPEFRDVVLGGSFAKGTWLPKNADIDIFVRLDPSTPDERFEEVGLAIGAEAARGYPLGKKYAQHPYTEASVEGVRVNIVPCYAVRKGEWKSAADRSPFHVRLVRRLPSAQKTEIKLLKRFMKAVGVYGAEIEVQGFSGYSAEVLTIEHGDLGSVLEFFASIGRHSEEKFFTLPDPIDPRRDLGVAISAEKLGRMVLASREFLSKPRPAYFTRMAGHHRRSLSKEVVAVVFSHPNLSEDTLWGELRKTLKHLVRHSELHGFKIARAMAASDNMNFSAFLLIPEFFELPTLEQRVGPTVDRRKDVEAFVSSNSSAAELVWVDDDARVRLLQEREFTSLGELLAAAVKGKGVPLGGSEAMTKAMKRNARVLRGPQLARASRSAKWLRTGIVDICSDALGTRAS